MFIIMTYALGTYRLEDAVGNILINGSGDFGGAISNLFKLTDPIFNATDTDDDGDGVNDADEALIGTNPLLVDTDGNGTDDGAEDFDNDGIDNATESDENAAITTDINPADGNSDITFDNSTLSVDDYNIINVVILPNPFNDRISIKLPTAFDNDSFEIKLFNLNGRVILNYKSQSVNNGLINIENLNILSKGIYLMKITNDSDGKSKIVKLIKN